MANPPARSTVSASINDNRLTITLAGNISRQEAERIYTDIRFMVADLKPGFAAITDLSHSRLGHLSAIGTFRKIMAFLKEQQVGHVIRVIGKGRIIYLQMLQLATSESEYRPIYVESMDEAKAHLAKIASIGNRG